MTHNETRVSNERLAATIQRLIGKGNAMVGYMDTPEAIEAGAATSLASWQREAEAAMGLALQALRSTPVETEPDFYALHSPTRSHIGLWPKKDDAEQAQREYENSTLTPLYAQPLPNPSPSDGEVSEAMREEAAQAANVLMKCNGHDLDVWTEGEWPVDADDWLRPLASRKSVQSNESSTKDEQEGLDEAIAKVEGQFPGAFWHLAKGRLSAGEPMFGFQALFGPDEIMAEGEGDSAVAAISAALQSKRGQP